MAAQTVLVADALVVPPGPVTVSVRRYRCEAELARAGKVSGTETATRPELAPHVLVTGKPVIAGVAEIVHVDERVTLADSSALPPAEGRLAGVTLRWAIPGAGSRTTTATGLAVVFPPGPLTVSPNLYVFWYDAELAGRLTVRLADPWAQETLAGSPASAGDEVKSQVLAFFTAALIRTLPPCDASVVGLARKYLTAGWALLAGAALAGRPDASRHNAAPAAAATLRHRMVLMPDIF
jgi:hypothetical protein